jgi:hypothetical protein
MVRHRSWVWRRLMLAESLDTTVQGDVRLGLLAARAAVSVSRLPRGNQQAASAVVMRRGLTVRQTELLVDEVLCLTDLDTGAALLARRLEERSLAKIPGPRSTRAVRNEADWMSADILKARDVSARLQARLGANKLETFTPAAAELLRTIYPRFLTTSDTPQLDQMKGAAEGSMRPVIRRSARRYVFLRGATFLVLLLAPRALVFFSGGPSISLSSARSSRSFVRPAACLVFFIAASPRHASVKLTPLMLLRMSMRTGSLPSVAMRSGFAKCSLACFAYSLKPNAASAVASRVALASEGCTAPAHRCHSSFEVSRERRARERRRS